MTITEFMTDKAKPKVMYRIGSASCFFFVGTKEEFFKDIDRLSRNYFEYQQGRAKELERYLNKNPDSFRIESVKRVYELICDELSKFTPYKTREVIECYKRISGDGIVVRVQGNEVGKYWDREEYERKNR